MRYSVCNWIYGDEPLEETMRRLSRFGYDGIEIMGEPKKYNPQQVKKLLRKYHLEVTSITSICGWPTTERDLANPDKRIRKRAIAYVRDCLQLASDIGAPFAGVIPLPVGRLRPLKSLQDEWRWAVESVKEIVSYVEDTNVFLALEPLNRYESCLLNNVEQALRFVEEVASNYVKIMLDCFHMSIEEPDIPTALRKAKDYLIYVHLADSNRQGLGRGHTSFLPIIRTLKEIDYQGAIALEVMAPGPNPFKAIKDETSKQTLDSYLEESIALLRLYEKMVS